ncbi:MAG: glycosyltransferase family 2 protein [Candidatus Komeilibacteria bacterium]|nr:glycosyltransferase family 2 protein [Candidatus Komeilibacteria bacterium]
MQPYIAIIVLHYKNLSDTRECLQSLQKIDYPAFSVIVVNNDAPNHGQILKKEFGDFITLIQNKENLGFSEGNNIGIRSALADKSIDAVFLLNNDTVIDPNILRAVAAMDGDMIAVRMMQFDNRDAIDNLGIELMAWSGLPFNRRDDKAKLFCPCGGAAFYSRKLLEVIATKGWFFDPLFYAYAEDLDLGFRARLAGFSALYTPEAAVYHKGSAATAKMSDFAVYHTYRNLIWTHFKNTPLLLLLWQLPCLAIGWIFLFCLYTAKGQGLTIWRAFFDGIVGLRLFLPRRAAIQKKYQVSSRTILSWFAPGLFPKNYWR